MNWCDDCGLCCMHMRTPPFIRMHDPEWDALPGHLKDEITNYLDGPRATLQDLSFIADQSPCIWLDLITGKCRHYEHRPSVCRDFQVGNESCRDWRSSVGLTIEGMPVAIEENEA